MQMYKRAILLFIFLGSVIGINGANEAEERQLDQTRDFLELKKKDKEIRELEGITHDVKKNLQLLKNMNLSLETKIISLTNSSIIKLELHPLYFSKIFLPEGSNIVNFEPSIPMNSQSFKWNRAKLKPNPDFVACNIDLTFELNKKFYDVSIFVEKYDVSRKNDRDNLFYPKVLLTFDEPLEPSNIIKLYRDSYGTLPLDPVTYFKYMSLVYKIEKDEFLKRDPQNKPNVEVIYANQLYKYKVSNGVKND